MQAFVILQKGIGDEENEFVPIGVALSAELAEAHIKAEMDEINAECDDLVDTRLTRENDFDVKEFTMIDK